MAFYIRCSHVLVFAATENVACRVALTPASWQGAMHAGGTPDTLSDFVVVYQAPQGAELKHPIAMRHCLGLAKGRRAMLEI